MADANQESIFRYAGRLLGIGQQPPNKQPIVSGGSMQSQPVSGGTMLSSGTMQAQPVSSGSIAAAPMTPEEERKAAEAEARMVAEAGMVTPAAPKQQPTRSPSGAGVIDIKPNAEEMYVFPEDRYRQKFESDQALFDKNSKKRVEAATQMALLLASPEYRKFPAHVREADAAAMKAMVDQMIPLPTPKYKFQQDFPQVERLAKSIEVPYRRRANAVVELGKQVELIDNTFAKYGKDSKEAITILVPQLMGMLKVYNTALSGTSDALSQAEVSRLSPELNPRIFDLAKANQLGGKVFGSDVERFKQKLASLHDILISEVNTGWNVLAVESSPEFANQRLGRQFGRPFGTNVAPRFEGKIPKRVAEGALSYSDYIKQREALFSDLLPKAEQAKTTILTSPLSPEQKRERLQELNRRFNAATGREIQLPDEFLIPPSK